MMMQYAFMYFILFEIVLLMHANISLAANKANPLL